MNMALPPQPSQPPPTQPMAPVAPSAPSQPQQQSMIIAPEYSPGQMPEAIINCGVAPPPSRGAFQAVCELIPKTIRYQGNEPSGAESVRQFYDYLMYQFKATVEGVDESPEADNILFRWLNHMFENGIFYELDDATRADTTPTNPPSPNTDEQQPLLAQPTQAPEAPSTPNNTSTEEMPPVNDKEKLAAWDRISGHQCKSLRGLKSRLTKTHKTSWQDYCSTYNLDPANGMELAGGQPTTVLASEVPTTTPPEGPGAPPLAQAPQAAPAAPPGGPGAPPLAQAPQAAPAAPQAAPAAPQAAPAVPTGPVTPRTLPPPAEGYGMPTPEPLQNQQAPPAPAPTTTLAVTQPPEAVTPKSRVEMAELLGGQVHLLLVRVKEVGAVDSAQWTDANQLSRIASAQSLKNLGIEYGFDAKKFRQQEQVTARDFDNLLTQYPNVMVLMNGYDWILNKDLTEILMSRVVTISIVQEQGSRIDRIDIK